MRILEGKTDVMMLVKYKIIPRHVKFSTLLWFHTMTLKDEERDRMELDISCVEKEVTGGRWLG